MTNYSEIALVRGLNYLSDVQAAIAHNLANVDTRSFKRRSFHTASDTRSFESELQARLPTVRYHETTDWRPGMARETGNRLNVSLDGPYFFRVQDEAGRSFYTRDGEMRLDAQGRLVTRNGMRYLDQKGAEIALRNAEGTPGDVAISPNGMITDTSGSGQSWGPLGVWSVKDRTALQPRGDGLFVDTAHQDPALAAAPAVQQGYLEGSNVDTLQEMVQMILVQRTFSATQRALTGVGRMHSGLIDNMLR